MSFEQRTSAWHWLRPGGYLQHTYCGLNHFDPTLTGATSYPAIWSNGEHDETFIDTLSR